MFGVIVCLQSYTKPAPFCDEEDAIREREACDYCDRITYEEAISGRGNWKLFNRRVGFKKTTTYFSMFSPSFLSIH